MKKKLGVILNGVGHMGIRGYFSLISLRETLRRNNIFLEIIALIEPAEEKKELIKKVSSEKIYSNLDDNLIKELSQIFKEYGCILIYDAGPTKYHSENLQKIMDYKKSHFLPFYYFGEKPISTDKEFIISSLKDLPQFYCDFIELENPAYLRLKEYVSSNNFEIEKIEFYRASTMGFDKTFKPEERTGVTGGALEDKGIHDIALTIDLLGGISNIEREFYLQRNPISNREEIFIKKPEILPLMKSGEFPWFMPAHIGSFLDDEPLFMDTSGEVKNGIKSIFSQEDIRGKTNDGGEYWYFAADAEFRMDVNWYIKNRPKNRKVIPINYYFSWVGVPQELKRKMSNLGVKDIWLGKSKGKVKIIKNAVEMKYPIEEARIGIIEGVLKGQKEIIVCNFLRKEELNVSNQWVDIIRDKKIETLPLNIDSLPYEENQLARMFEKVIQDILYNNTNISFRKDIICLSHLVISVAREKVFLELILAKDKEECIKKDKQYMRIYKTKFQSLPLDFLKLAKKFP